MAGMDWKDAAASHLGGDTKSPKVIKHISVRKNHAGTGHIIEHHHTNPMDHQMEEHTTQGDDQMVGHMMDHIGTPNPGEAEADAGNPGPMLPQEASAGNASAPPVPGMMGGQ